MLDPYAIALQGIGFSPRLVALQGFAEIVVPGKVGGRRHKGVRFEPYKGDLAQIHQEDESVTDLLIALVIKGFFNGKT
jgi:hypothetical protein